MTAELNQMVAIAQQHFGELIRLSPLSNLKCGEFRDGAARQRVEWLLERLSDLTTMIQGVLNVRLKSTDDSPILGLPSPHAEFLRSELLPNARALEEAHLKSCGLEILLELFEDEEDDGRNPVKNSLWFVTDYANVMLNSEDERRWEVDIAVDALEDPWFQPDRWRENLRMLRPVLVGRDTQSIPAHVRFRLAEVYRTFAFGAWMATIALCRAIVEFSIINRASYLEITATRKGSDGVERYKKLDELIDLASGKHPELVDSLKALKDAGNRILHPKKKQNIIASPRVLKSEALDSIKATVQAVEVLYAR